MRVSFSIALVLTLAACGDREPAPAPPAAANPAVAAAPAPAPAAAIAPTAPGVADDSAAAVSFIDTHVRGIEAAQSASQMVMTEIAIADGALGADAGDTYAKLHAYADATGTKRIKLYPADPAGQTREFYFMDGALVQVSVEAVDNPAPLERWYFSGAQLKAIRAADASMRDIADPAAAASAARLLALASRVKDIAANVGTPPVTPTPGSDAPAATPVDRQGQ